MNLKKSCLFTGGFILIAGIFIVLVSFNPSRTIEYVVVTCTFLAGIFTMIMASKNKYSDMPLHYHWVIGIGLVVYAMAIAFFTGEMSSFLEYTSYFLLLYGIVEILFTFQVLNSRKEPGRKVILFKVITGLIASIGAMWVLTTSQVNANVALLFSGLITFLIGLSFILVSNYLVQREAAN